MLQGSSSSVFIHSLSGTQYSVALIRYCAGRSIRTTEKIPKETLKNLSPSWLSQSVPDTVEDTQSGITLQQHPTLHTQQSLRSLTLTLRIIGSTTSAFAHK